MKHILKLYVLLLLGSCTNYTSEPFIVSKIETSTNASVIKYCININNTDIRLFTNHRYNIGDTIK